MKRARKSKAKAGKPERPEPQAEPAERKINASMMHLLDMERDLRIVGNAIAGMNAIREYEGGLDTAAGISVIAEIALIHHEALFERWKEAVEAAQS